MNDELRARTALLGSSSEAATRVFTTILTRSPISRIDVARLTGLSQAAVTKAVTPLLAAGLVDDSLGVTPTGLPGRPANPVAVVPDSVIALGIKVNVDELIGVATDLTTRIIASDRVELASHDPVAVVDAIVRMCARLQEPLGDLRSSVASIGVSVSGDVDTATGIVRDSAIMGWHGVELAAALREHLDAEIVVDNDVRALTIGEHWFGVGLGTRSFAIVTIGRGIGSGLHLNGEVVEGAYGVAGEIGHLPLTSPDRVCACGRRGCVEAVAATSAIVAAVSAAHGRPVTVEEAVALAHAGDRAAVEAFGEAGAVIGLAIASLVNMVGPELVIIGGEGVVEFGLFEERLRAAYAEHVFESAGRCRIVVRPHTFEDWARGAAASAIRSLVV
ncbi:Sugar kinase of the NBD/HSP70 family, may contain an N-terminal HTH domain [Leifsonia sp. 98AMF]|uniref:ROK family protein n=1 Tax=unclassified Leifsonia TaxID=2663824 RepID=UPI00087A8852|nr:MULTISPECIES: ROK family protein [unclassified Leifsonia]SDH11064.1 Sugar kinase of the NBD/HSP70 family, may contain an N-terminal HTH domain [Leifsonia sp. 197AMF]SDJ27686.1 Sugar kinase of the NBD/HSP70 family, may contain an N-terminal HTH domain [Leifsonia sp. 466MF]SDK53417.1 Sugar kinase of the NBD/HSP70 family, may contain an N-terminal HTH domain [Leifsonia sp. 157MF]SDN49735.1 Sugar kinase of the NBD/HSP70 family, may contain an N-terminal HTH domain [Leifsonia sp. 509MF]SEN60790.